MATCHERSNNVLVFSTYVKSTQNCESIGQECNPSTSGRKPHKHVHMVLVINYIRRFQHGPSLMLLITHTHTHTQLALPRVIKIEEEIILFYSAGLLHSLKLTVDFDMAGTIWVIKERCVTKRSSFVWRGGCNPHFELLALPNLGTFLRDHKFYSYDVYKNCCWLLSVFTDFTSRHMCNYFRWKTITASHQLHVCQTSQL